MPKLGLLGRVALQFGQDTSKPVVPVGYKGDKGEAAATPADITQASAARIMAAPTFLPIVRFMCLPSLAHRPQVISPSLTPRVRRSHRGGLRGWRKQRAGR